MAEVDKENQPPDIQRVEAAKRSETEGVGTDRSSPTTTAKAPLGPASLAFPVEDPDEDRDVLASDGKTLRSKRSVLFYPSAGLAAKSNQQPFSRSAAKRESILALGSIGYLQHLYTKQGIASRNRPLTRGAMTLAIGPAGEAMMSSGAGVTDAPTSDASAHGKVPSSPFAPVLEEEDDGIDLPPSPKAGTLTRPHFLDVARPLEADARALGSLLVADLARLSTAWALSAWIDSDPGVAMIKRFMSQADTQLAAYTEATASSPADLLTIIDITTKAIRSVRSYLLALPQRHQVPLTGPTEPKGRDLYKRQSSFSGVPRPGQFGVPLPTRASEMLRHDTDEATTSTREARQSAPAANAPSSVRDSNMQSVQDADNLGIVRKAALEMLSALKDMEIRYRVQTLDDGTDADMSIPLATSNGNGSATPENRNADEAIASSDIGYLYRTDLRLSDLDKERAVLQGYLQTVSSVLSTATSDVTEGSTEESRLSSSRIGGTRASDGQSQSVHSTIDATFSINLESPEHSTSTGSERHWTVAGLSTAERVSSFMIEHCRACVGQSLSQSRLDQLHRASGELEEMLALLCDGYLVCRVFNEAVRRSDKPWGYISTREMHDLEAEEAALLHKEALRAKQALEADALHFQTRADRKSLSEQDAKVGGTQSQAPWFESNLARRPGWTFRKTENLRVWAAALKLRYQIQTTATRAVAAKPALTAPTYGSLGMGKLALHGRRVASDSYATRGTSVQVAPSKTIDFDPAKVARNQQGWQEMLTTVLIAWIDAVAKEQTLRDTNS